MSHINLVKLLAMVPAFGKGLREGKPPSAVILDPAPRELIEEYNRLRELASNKDINNLPEELTLENKPSFTVLMVFSDELKEAVTPAERKESDVRKLTEKEQLENYQLMTKYFERKYNCNSAPVLPEINQPEIDQAELRRIANRITTFCKSLNEVKPPIASMYNLAPKELIEEYNRLRTLASNKGIDNLPNELILENNPFFCVLIVLSAVLEAAVNPPEDIVHLCRLIEAAKADARLLEESYNEEKLASG